MRIAMVHTPLVVRAGGERQILRLAIELQKQGNSVEIFTNAVNEERCYPNLLKKVTINVVPHPFVRFGPFYLRVAKKRANLYDTVFPRMLNIGRSIPKGFDIINNHNFPTEWAAFFAKKRLKIPVVWMCNEPPFWFFHPEQRRGSLKSSWPLFEIFDKIAVAYIDEIAVLSHSAESLVGKIYNRTSKIIRSGVDVEIFHKASRQQIRKKYNLQNDFVLLQVGGLIYYRRQIDSLEALFYLSKKYDNVKLILDGAGQQEMLRDFSRKLGVENKVIFLVTDNDKELAKIYAACDVFLYPSEVTWGLVVTEAMAARRAVIVSNKAGVSEIIKNNVNGTVVNHAKPKEIAEQVERLMDDPKLRKKLGENAYEYVKRNLSWEKYAENMESVFQQTISNFRRGTRWLKN
jgi:glycosyltransferase involved in cell wall biosynthesis